MSTAIEYLVKILESPDVEKHYRDLKKYYESMEMMAEAEAFNHLITTRFHEKTDDISIAEEQREDDQQLPPIDSLLR